MYKLLFGDQRRCTDDLRLLKVFYHYDEVRVRTTLHCAESLCNDTYVVCSTRAP